MEFNLAELFCNEILLAAYSSDNSSGDILFYFKSLIKIMKICNLNIKYVDSSMKVKLYDGSSAQSTSNKVKTNLPIDQFLLLKYRSNGHKEENSYQEFSQVLKLNYERIKQKNMTNEKLHKNNNDLKKCQNEPQEANIDNINQLELDNISNLSLDELKSSNNSHWSLEKYENVPINIELENYTKQLYKNIITNIRQKQYYCLQSSQDINIFFNKNYVSFRPKCDHCTTQGQIAESSLKLLSPKN